MRWVELEQGTPEWHAWRESRYTASQAGAVMNASPWFPRTPFQLYQLRTGQREVEVNAAMRAGSADEAKIRHAVAWNVGEMVVPMCAEATLGTMPLGASLDAVAVELRQAWELKRPAKGSESELWTATEAPANYLWQMVHTMLCAPIDQIALVVYAHDLDEVRTVDSLFRDSDRYRMLESRLIKAWAVFHQHFESLIPPPLSEGDEVVIDELRDEGWRLATQQYAEALARQKAAEAEVEVTKANLVALAEDRGHGQKVRGCGFQVFRVERAGNINWKAKPIQAALAAAKIDPEAYRGKSSTFWSVREAGNDE